MSFQYENVILPDEPVLLVNRDWQIPGRKPRKSKKGQQNSYRAVHSFKVKGQPEGSGKIALASGRGKGTSTAPGCTLTAVAGGSSGTQGGRRAQLTQELGGREPQLASQSPPSDSSSSEGDVFQATLLDNHSYDIVPISRRSPARRPIPGVDASLLKLTSYEAPDFIPKAHYFNYCASLALSPVRPATLLTTTISRHRKCWRLLLPPQRHVHAEPAAQRVATNHSRGRVVVLHYSLHCRSAYGCKSTRPQSRTRSRLFG
jgi:hypothetical protein